MSRVFIKRHGFSGKKQKPKDMRRTLKRLLSYLNKYRIRMFFIIICIIVGAISSTIGTMFIKNLIDDYIAPLLYSSHPDYSQLSYALIKIGVVFLFGVLSVFYYTQTSVFVSHNVLKTIRDEMFNHMQFLPVRFFDSNNFGEIMSLYSNDTDTLRQMLSQSIIQVFSSLITIIAVFSAMLVTSWQLTIFVLLFVFLMFWVSKTLGSKSSKYFVSQQQSLAKTNGHIEEFMKEQKVVKVFNYEKKAYSDFLLLNEQLRNDSKKANGIANIFMPVIGNLGNFQYVAIAVIGGILAINGIGNLTLGTIGAFLILSKNFSGPIAQVGQQFNSILMALAGAERIFNMLDTEKEEDNGKFEMLVDNSGKKIWKNIDSNEIININGKIELQNINFGYLSERQILFDVSLTANPGSVVALVGSTGAGKTTIANLISRFYSVNQGQILFDGINIQDIKKDSLRKNLGMVLQEVNLFTGTVADNIRFGLDNATDEDVKNAAKMAEADGFIKRLPNGYQTIIKGDGSQLSQGQKQLLSIARAFISNPPVMILDEATSSIDTRTECLVQKGMNRLMKGRTVFIIAHRLSTVRNADEIVVIEHGKIVERGNHNKLIEKKGRYYQLYTGNSQLA